MDRRQLNALRLWHPPKKWHTKGYGEYTKTEALYILTTAVKYSWGRKFDCRTLDYEQQLMDIAGTMDGITDSTVFMRTSMTPPIISSLTPWDYEKWFRSLKLYGQVPLPSELVIRFLQGMAHMPHQEFVVVGGCVHFGMRDISGKPLAYEMRLPRWMLGVYYGDTSYSEILHDLAKSGTISPG